MLDKSLLRQIEQIVGARHLGFGRADAEVYSYDASLATAVPDAVVLPADTEQTAAVVRAASRAGVRYVPRGFGTNLSGGSIAAGGGLVIGLARLNRILAIRPEGRYAVVQPGVTNLELQNALAPLGFYYAPDPASQKVATLGGNVGENAGGPHCLKYGVTTNHVLGLKVVLPGGDVVDLGGPALDPPGYDLRGLLVGSEGTLAIVTELVVRILPCAESVLTLLAVYDRLADAARSVSAIIAAGIVPATLEMMDATIIRAVEDSKPCGYPRDAAAVLIAEVDGPAVGLSDQAERIGQLCVANGCREVRRAMDAGQRERLWAGRRGAFGAVARLAPSFLVADCTVPRTLLPEALARVGRIAAKHGLSHGNVFHAGDGNLHPLLLFDSRDADQVRRVHQAGQEIMAACVALGGTISGEHGVGCEKADAMRLLFSEDDLDFQRRIRAAFDPLGLLNPGKIFPDAPDAGCGATAAAGGVGNAPTAQRHLESVPQPASPERIPTDAAEACEMVKDAYVHRTAMVPRGNGTLGDFGNYSAQPARLLRSTKLAAIREYDPANQVVTVGAGVSLAALDEVLAEHGQWLPLRPPLAGRRTVGGIVALGACGPERLRYGAPRDLLLGLAFVCGTGKLIRAGGRVVKNVAGYDVTRLLAGSAGALGFLTEVCLRVLSLPECCLAVAGSGTLAQCGAAAAALLRSPWEPNCVVAVPDNPEGRVHGSAAWQLIAGFEGFRKTVACQVACCRAEMEKAGLTCQSPDEYPARHGRCGAPLDALYQGAFVVRVDLPPDRVAEFVSGQGELFDGAAVLVDFGCGRMTLSQADLTDQAWQQWRHAADRDCGTVLLEKAPDAFRQRHEVFGTPRSDWQLMHRLKAALDPANVFSPGRMPGRK